MDYADSPNLQETPNEPLRNSSSIDILQVLQRRWAVVLSILSISFGGGVAYWYLTPPTYESQAQLLIMRKDPRLATAGVQNSRESGGISEEVLATHMQILQSRRMVGTALREAGMDQIPSIQMNLADDETPTEYVIDRLDVTRGGTGQAKSADILNISFRLGTAVDAQKIVSAIIAQYQSFVEEKFEDVNEEAAVLITQAREELVTELEQVEAKHREMRMSAPLLWNGEESTNIHRANFERIQTELSILQSEAAQSKARLQILARASREGRDASGLLQQLALIDDSGLSRLGVFADIIRGDAAVKLPMTTQTARAEMESLLQLVAKERTLRQDYGPKHPAVTAVRLQIATVRQFLSRKQSYNQLANEIDLSRHGTLVDAYARILQHDLESIQSRENALQDLSKKEEAAAKELVVFELEDETLRKQVARKQELYNAVVDRLREINLAKDYGGFINEVIAEPTPGEEVWPKLSLCLALSVFAGLVFSTGGAFAADYFDRRFRDIGEVGQVLGLPILAEIPSLKPRKKDRQWELRDENIDTTVCVYHAPRSPQSEVFRGLRTQLFFVSNDQPLRTIAVTSPKPGDGKSTMAVNLGLVMAQAGRSVLLVDCDMRKPRQHTLLGIENNAGIAEVLAGTADPWTLTHKIGDTNASFISAGQIPDNPAELLESDRFLKFLESAKEHFDVVIVDCPPMLKVSDPAIVASRVDGVLLALRLAQNTKPEAIHSRELLRKSGANLLGLVLNCWDFQQAFNSYGGYGYGGYGYGEEEAYGDDPELLKKMAA